MAVHQFQTEVSQLLHLIIHSLYSNREIFLRELVSNASDALDKLKYLTVADDAYKSLVFDPRIDISFHKDTDKPANSTITITDNGIGMNEADLIESLGTIARSGTRLFLEKMAADAKKDSNLIGQFGVGFYSAFMVSSNIEVISRKALEDATWKWTSDGHDGYDLEKLSGDAARSGQGTQIILHLSEEGAELCNRWTIEDIVKRYSNHVAFPIYLSYEETERDDKGKEKGKVTKTDRLNSGTAIWRRSKSELKEEDYVEFYKGLSGDSSEPLHYVHTKAEGTLEYDTLFYFPKKAPADMYRSDFKAGVKLYVKRVFITDDDKELLPPYLRFVRGVIDSEDLPLNVSREILQQNKILSNIKNASVKKILSEIQGLADAAASGSDAAKEKWQNFVAEYNRPLKEGLYQDWMNGSELQRLVRYRSTAVEGYTGFADYVSRMKDGQKYIYYITGGDEKTLRSSPLLEAYREKDIEVLIMDEEIDDIIMPAQHSYRVEEEGKKGDKTEKVYEYRAINRVGAEADLGEKKDKKAEKEAEKEAKPLLERIKKALGDRVKDVRLSRRLRDSPSCIVTEENDPSIQLSQIMRAMGQADMPDFIPILEVNMEHPIVSRLKTVENDEELADVASILLDQALIVEGVKLNDPAGFVKRLNRYLTK
ncbi:chaperone protein HtpG [Spirochaetia bacterium]|nr:chaperone protein HtpG [Spirochaetia bacterium]